MNNKAALIAVSCVAIAAAIFLCCYGSQTARQMGRLFRATPKAVVEQPKYDLGIIESPAEFAHCFVIRNEGRAPLALARGPSTCSCTLSNLPADPIRPGDAANINVTFSDAAKNDELKSGPFSESVTIRTNDPDHENIVLKMSATVRRPVEIEPSPLVLVVKAADGGTQDKRSAEAYVYSRIYEHFDLTAVEQSRAAMKCLIAPSDEDQLKRMQVKSGYRVTAVLPPDMPDGEFNEWLEFIAVAAGETGPPRRLRLKILGKIESRLAIYGPKVDANQILRLGVLSRGETTRDTLLMKIDDPGHAISVKSVETEPEFMRVNVSPIRGESAKAGLFRVEVEIPGDARACDYMGDHPAVIRINTDDRLLPQIELRVSLAVVVAGS